jgi:hypothetical protein
VSQLASAFVHLHSSRRSACCFCADPDLVRQVGQKRFVDFHDRSLPAQELVGDPGVNLFQNSGIMFAR